MAYPPHPFRQPFGNEPTADDIIQHFPHFLGTDAFLQKTAAEKIIAWLQNADPLIVPDALDFMVTRGVVKKFAELFRGSTPHLEGLAGVVFGFLANGDTRHATIAFNAGILPTCIERLSTGDLEARIKSAWILGNLAADNAECAEALMERGVLEIMFDQMTTITNATEISSHGPYSSMLLWAINHFLKSTPGLTPSVVLPIQNLLSVILLSDVEDVVLEETCYSLSSIIQLSSDPSYGLPFTSDKTCSRLIRLLQRGSNIALQRASLQLVGALTGRSDEYTTLLLRCNLLPALAELVEHPLGEDACWVLSNIVAENIDHLRMVVLMDSRVLPTVIRLLKVDASGFDEDEFAGRTRECCNILAAVIRMGEVECIRRMVALGGISALCTALLYVAENDVLVVILDALWKVVLFGESDRILVRGGGGMGLDGGTGGSGIGSGGAEGMGLDLDSSLGLQAPFNPHVDRGGGEECESVNLYLRLFEESSGFDGLYRLENRKDRVVAEAAQQMLALIDEIMNAQALGSDDENDTMVEDTSAEGIVLTEGMTNGHGDFHAGISRSIASGARGDGG